MTNKEAANTSATDVFSFEENKKRQTSSLCIGKTSVKSLDVYIKLLWYFIFFTYTYIIQHAQKKSKCVSMIF